MKFHRVFYITIVDKFEDYVLSCKIIIKDYLSGAEAIV
jgi:hypothetical protein